MMRVGVTGAGILGQVTALRLLNAGHQVSLFDPGDPPGQLSCSRVGAGMLAPHAEVDMAEALILTLGKDSVARWKAIIGQLKDPVYLQSEGTLIIAHPQDANELERFKRSYRDKTGSTDSLQELNAEQTSILEPSLAGRFHPSIYLHQEGHISSTELLPSLTKTLTEKGIYWHQAVVTKITPNFIVADRAKYTFDWVVDCRGMGAKEDYPTLRGVRGELLWLKAPEVKLNRPVRLMHPRHPIYIVPRLNNLYVIGASIIESDDNTAISVQTTLELLSAVYSLHPGFSEARVIHTATHSRPAFPDNLPKIFHQPGLIAANGLFRHGYLLAPLLSDMIYLLIEGRKPEEAHGIITSG